LENEGVSGLKIEEWKLENGDWRKRLRQLGIAAETIFQFPFSNHQFSISGI
jgi:hypothetical protein